MVRGGERESMHTQRGGRALPICCRCVCPAGPLTRTPPCPLLCFCPVAGSTVLLVTMIGVASQGKAVQGNDILYQNPEMFNLQMLMLIVQHWQRLRSFVQVFGLPMLFS